MKAKVKPIQTNITVSTPTEEEVNELLAILYENGWDVSEPFDGIIKETEGILVHPRPDLGWWGDINFAKSVGHAILTLAEFKERYCEEEKPQVGDKVKVTNPSNWSVYRNAIGKVVKLYDCHVVSIEFPDGNSSLFTWDELSILEPYTEPETKPTDDMETKEYRNLSQDVANCDKSEDKQLNLCELLKGHEGETFYSLVIGECVLTEITPSDTFPIKLSHSHYTPDGKFELSGETVIFPSRALYEQYPLDPYTAWMKWQEEHKEYPITVVCYDSLSSDKCELLERDINFRTPADRDKCIEEIKAVIEKYSKK